MRVFITGATGFVGSHLVETLLNHGSRVSALVHDDTSHQALPPASGVAAIPGDLREPESVQEAMSRAQADVVFHLAGQASPGRSWQAPAETIAVNTGGTANILQAAVKCGKPRVIVVTSAHIYAGITEEELPITEETQPRPAHPYGVSKLAAGQLCALYWQRFELPVIEVRPFNHIGPRQAKGFVVPDFASQVAAIALGQAPATIEVGNLAAERDFTDVRDIVRAYLLLAEKGRPGNTYLACSGRPVPVRKLLDTLIDLAGIEVEVREDLARFRAEETPRLYGSHDRLKRDVGWKPTIPLRQSLEDALNDWKNRLAP